MAKNNKKAYARIDFKGKIIPGSTVLRSQKPKIGRWIEITADVCCTTTTIVE